MNNQPVSSDIDQMFEAVMDELEAATEITTRGDRTDWLDELALHCANAARLTAGAIAASS